VTKTALACKLKRQTNDAIKTDFIFIPRNGSKLVLIKQFSDQIKKYKKHLLFQ
jgi:hypothetical protein